MIASHRRCAANARAPRLGAAALVLLATLAACGEAAPIPEAEVREHVETELLDALPDSEDRPIGIAAAIIRGDRQEVVLAGMAQPEWVFELGSLTQLLTGVLFAEMVGRGDVSMQDPISKLLPPGVESPSRDGREIELGHLATHQATLPRLPPNLEPEGRENPWGDYTEEMLFEAIAAAKLVREPGASPDESWYGYGLLGHLLGRAAGRNYAEALSVRVLGPLGMQETAIGVRPGFEERVPPGHMGPREVPHWDLPSMDAAYAGYSTIADMARFLRAAVDHASSPLGPAFDLAQQVHAEDGAALRFGFGWRHREQEGQRIVWQQGTSHGFQSYIGIAAEARIGVVVLANFEREQGLTNLGVRLVTRLAERQV